jgi:GMP reductase
MPANMKCVIDCDLANKLQSNNYFYVMHRFGINNYEFVLNANKEAWNTISISVGVKDDDYNTLRRIQADNLSLDYITVDVAHGHCKSMREMLSFLKQTFPDTTTIAGNVGTPAAALDLISWGADVIKIGIGPGKSCITKLKTGFFTPMFSTVKRIKESCGSSIKLIADGGIQHNGDITKALVAGADFIMAGSIFAQCVDSPGEIINGEKVYFGSASAENKGFKKNVEGKKMLLPTNGFTYFEKLKEIQEDLQSSMSYAGVQTLSDLINIEYLVV